MGRLTSDRVAVDAFVRQYVFGVSLPDFRAIGYEKGGRIVNGLLYENFNRTTVWCHIAVAPGEVLYRPFLDAIFDYPFEQLRLGYMRVYVSSKNAAVVRLVERLNFFREAELEGAGDSGENMYIYTLRAKERKYGVTVRRRWGRRGGCA